MIPSRWVSLLVLFAVFSLPIEGRAADLDRYRWRNRLLLLFDTEENAPAYAKAVEAVARRHEEAADRDLVVFHVLEEGPSRVDERRLTEAAASQLRSRFDIQPGGFTAVLVGKDGGVKLVRQDTMDLQEIFDRIDAMPMRQQEMREKKTR